MRLTMHRILAISTVLSLAVLPNCNLLPADVTDNVPGAVSFHFGWEHPPQNRGTLFAYLKVEDRSQTRPRTLVTKGPFEYQYGQEGISQPLDIPNGSKRVMIVEMREVASLSADPRYVGVSNPFDLEPIHIEPIKVSVTLRAVPCVEPADPSEECRVVVQGPNLFENRWYTRTADITVCLTPGAATRMQLSNMPSFSPDESLLVEKGKGEAGCSNDAGVMIGWPVAWNINHGATSGDGGTPRCTVAGGCDCDAGQGCKRTLHARFLDNNGYPSPALSVDLTWDNVPPELVVEATDGGLPPTRVEPAQVNRSSTLTVNLRATERLEQVPHLYVVGAPDVRFQPPWFDSPTDVFSFQSTGLLGLKEGSYEVRASLVDVAGNVSNQDCCRVGTFTVDSTAPIVDIQSVVVSHGNTTQQLDGGILRVGNNGVVAVTFSSTESLVGQPVDGGEPSFTVTVDNQHTHACMESLVGDRFRYTCSGLTITAPDGGLEEERNAFVMVNGQDRAGNAGGDMVPILVDFQGPTVVTEAFPSLVNAEATLTYSARFSEPLADTTIPTLTILTLDGGQPSGPLMEPGQPEVENQLYRWKWKPTSGTDGIYRALITATDSAGNASQRLGASFTVDVTAPSLSTPTLNGTTDTQPPRIGPNDTLEVRIAGSSNAHVSARIPGTPWQTDCTPDPAREGSYRCTFHLALQPGNELDGTEVATAVMVTARDDAGNMTVQSTALILDFRPPSATASEPTYQPGPDNPLTNVTAAKRGTKVSITISSTEAVQPSSVKAWATRETTELPLERDDTQPPSELTHHFMWRADVDGGFPSGPHQVVVELTDLVGNPSGRVNTGRSLDFRDLGSPTTTSLRLGVLQDKVTFVRNPWGSVPGEAMDQTVGAYVELAPGDGLSTRPSLDGDTFQFSDPTLRLMKVRVWARPPQFSASHTQLGEQTLVGTLDPVACSPSTPDGGTASACEWPRKKWSHVEVGGLVVTGLDNAGNESRPTPIVHSEWVATLGSGSMVNPHKLEVTQVAETQQRASRLLPPTVNEGGGTGLGAFLPTSVQSAIPWRRVLFTRLVAPKHFDHVASYDVNRERMVVVGGYAGVNDVWEWDGVNWDYKRAAGPPLLTSANMVFDTWSGRSFLFGGSANGVPQDRAWQWDGESWTEVVRSDPWPPANEGFALTHDAETGLTYLFGGLCVVCPVPITYDGFWEWNGESWRDLGEIHPNRPSPRGYPSMAFDLERHQMLLFGGSEIRYFPPGVNTLNDTWTWTPAGWQMVNTGTNKPTGRLGSAVTYDPVRKRVVLFGGCTEVGFSMGKRPWCITVQDDLWEWNGSQWEGPKNQGLVRPPARTNASMVFDIALGRSVMKGGVGADEYPEFFGDTWAWNGTHWEQHLPTTRTPPPREGSALTYHAGLHKGVLLGGFNEELLGDMWTWDGNAWSQVPIGDGGPEPRVGHALAYNTTTGMLLMYGGTGAQGALEDVWSFANGTWTPVTTAPGATPGPREKHLMAFDEARNQLVLFGGYATPETERDTWLGTIQADVLTWQKWDQGTAAAPLPRINSTMAYDHEHQRVLLYGGELGDTFVNDLWAWDGTRWDLITPSGTGPGQPTAARSARLVFDGRQRTMLLYGGQENSRLPLNSVWELTGSTWRELITSDPKPQPRLYSTAMYDGDHDALVAFGGTDGNPMDDLWIAELGAPREPAIQFTVRAQSALFQADQVTGLTVRAVGAGTAPDAGPGAVLLGYNAPRALKGEPTWTPLGANEAHPDGGHPWIRWDSQDGGARQYVNSADMELTFQVRPRGPSWSASTESQVFLDYIEARVHYHWPGEEPALDGGK